MMQTFREDNSRMIRGMTAGLKQDLDAGKVDPEFYASAASSLAPLYSGSINGSGKHGGHDGEMTDGGFQPGHGHEDHNGDRNYYKRDEDYRNFRRNVRDDPETAARSLVKFLDGLPPDKKKEFISQNQSHITDMLINLEKASVNGKVDPGVYDTITAALAPSQIQTIKGRDKSAGLSPARMPSPDPVSPAGEGNPQNRLVDARLLINSGDRKAAKTALDSLRTDYPGNPGVQSALARSYNDLRDYSMAARAATDAINLDPEDTEAYKNRALARASLQDRKGAIEDIKKVMELDPQDESAKMLSALVNSKKVITSLKSLSSLQEMRKAIGGAEASGISAGVASGGPAPDGARVSVAGQQGPDYTKSVSYLKTASSKNALGDYSAAVNYASKAIEKNPANSEAYLERANANNLLGHYDEAIRDTTEVISRAPSNVQALNMRAWALNRKGLAKDAEADANKAISINPGFADSWFNRALAYEKQGNYKRTLEDLRQAAVLNGAYGSRFKDAVAQYAGRVSGFSYDPVTPVPSRGGSRSGMTRFLILLGFTLTGGLLVALGLLHIMTSSREKVMAEGGQPYPNLLTPSIFYEGVASGKYKIERKIGEGGMGIVYEALDQSLGRTVAIKRMNEEIKVNEREKQRFIDEARTLAMLHHPNIVEIYTIFEEKDDIYLVCEHVNGVTLDKLLEKEVRMPFEKARTIFCEAAKALSYAHLKNVIHMDMKLSNIMISKENEVKVMDFGLARRAKESLARVSSREVVGSPAYMPPEQDLGVSSKESDIYALGVCLYETLTGELPFKGPDFHYQKERKLYRPASETVPGLPRAVDEFISRALSPDPGSRFQNAGDFRKELLDI
jgi:serine/threonine-protein kinase